jgi:glycosyltransferase involved in cell wall biosynthesis
MGKANEMDEAQRAALPVLSVIMPTYNRVDRLHEALKALAAQTIDPSTFEIIVVSDGSTDGTDEYLASSRPPLSLVGLTQPNCGPASARNHGVRFATADLVVFIDDDIIATPTLLERHLKDHAMSDHRAVIGPMANAADFDYSRWVLWEQAMLEKQYSAMRRGDFKPSFNQFYTGNASVRREHFLAAGGFNPALRRVEDMEFAYRLSLLGIEFVFDPEAVGHHCASRSYKSFLTSAETDGRNMVVLAHDHDQAWRLAAGADSRDSRHVLTRSLVTVCGPRPRVARVAVAMLGIASRVSTAAHVTSVSKHALSGVYALSHTIGAADEFGGYNALQQGMQQALADRNKLSPPPQSAG